MPAILSAALLALMGCDRQSPDADQAEPAASANAGDTASGLTGRLDISQRGSAMPVAAFVAPDGSPVSLQHFAGRPLLVNLWATWCGPCVIEMPTLDSLAQREEDRLQVLVVSQDIQGEAIVQPWFDEQDFTRLQPYLDTENALNRAFATGLMPTTVLYDADGREVWRVLGGMEWDGSRAAMLLEETLANP